jgi:hypothetical protein
MSMSVTSMHAPAEKRLGTSPSWWESAPSC